MVTFSDFPGDPRPRRAAEALLQQGAILDLICQAHQGAPRHEAAGEMQVFRLPISHRRGGKLSYAYQYSAFLLLSAGILALRCMKRRYDLVYVHNMPDVLVLSAVVPKAFGAKVILDMHDPMPELMTTIFGLGKSSRSVRLIQRLEKWSMAWADLVITVNVACQRIFSSRSCRPDKIGVVMNSPNEDIFSFRPPRERRQNGAVSRRLVVMYHGSIVERNGLDLAVEAVARLRSSVPGAELRIYGTKTPFLDQVMDDARARGLHDCVRYFGPRRLEELVQEIEDCDVGIIPNQRNAFTEINTPTRIFEYLALGKPVIAPRTAGIQDYFRPGSLLFFEPGNAEELAGQLEYVYFHRAAALEMAAQGQQIYLEHTWNEERQTLLKLVAGVLKKESR